MDSRGKASTPTSKFVGAESYVLKTAPFDELLAAIRGESLTITSQ